MRVKVALAFVVAVMLGPIVEIQMVGHGFIQMMVLLGVELMIGPREAPNSWLPDFSLELAGPGQILGLSFQLCYMYNLATCSNPNYTCTRRCLR